MQTLNQTLLNATCEIAFQAGRHLSQFYQRPVDIQIKADKTPVTEADLFLSQFISEQLQILTPNIPILSEENCKISFSERQKWQEYWIIDPLDGTQQFINQTGQFSVVITLIQHNRPVLGVIHAPILHKTYYAMKNFGAYVQNSGQIRPLAGKKIAKNLNSISIAMGRPNPEKVAKCVQPPYQFSLTQYGSSSLKTGLVLEGLVDCYLRFGDTGEWDTAAAEILLAETGGAVFDLDFQPLTYNLRETLINPHFLMVVDKSVAWERIFRFN